ncbi:MAG TPA: bacillithiol biosynthesis deacetylase BshB1 [bacterium]|nr:bacillithiol biosynthesis deacetylase BshB1 [bacterium]HPG44481.1 bacillithiol biosynthesis deacetylase BshB1 [bacterium]HPM97039.1 bacillithiol biosynthesis deacetylase BshB1 [bacterium]
MEQRLDVLAIGAHPDDVELMCGGTLARLSAQGYRTGILSLTQGEMGSRGSREQRKFEAQQAARILDVAWHGMLDIPDSNVAVNEENKLKVIAEIRRHRPDLVFAPPQRSRHPDHVNCSQLVREAVFFAGLRRLETDAPHFRPQRLAYYMEMVDFVPNFIVDISSTFEKKMASIQAYTSQFYQPGKEDREEPTFISSPEFYQSIISKAEYWGQKVGVRYGEPFEVAEPIGVDDPVNLLCHKRQTKEERQALD